MDRLEILKKGRELHFPTQANGRKSSLHAERITCRVT